MKKYYPLILLLILTSPMSLFAQAGKTVVITCSEFHITRPLRDIVAENPVDENKVYLKKESEDRENRKPQKFRFSVNDGPQYGNDPSDMQTHMGTVQGRAPITNWAGQNATGFRPFDPTGAAGPNNYVQMINSTTFKVYNKTTGVVSFTATLGNLWPSPTPNDGDPIVLYDKAADRWFLSQFGTSGNKIYIAISTTGDPGGSYYTYTFTSPAFPDYLKFSVWADGYYMTSNQTSQNVFCFERAAMIAGSSTSRALYTSFSPIHSSGFYIPLPGDASDGSLPVYGTPCPLFSYSDNGWGSGYTDAVNIYQMSVNWVPSTPTATITTVANIPTAAFDASYDPSWNDVSQPGTTQKLDGIGGVCMFRAQWKSFSGYNTTVLNWGVKISSTQRSIKWCELRQNQSTGVWSMYQEGIYTPDAATRWMGGIAMDNNGSIALCYMKSDASSIYPGIYYTGRRICDPLGTLPVTEELTVAGTGSQTGINRDGDYATLALDPDGITFWHTSEYMGGATGGSAAKTQIFSFQIPVCANTAIVNIAQTSGTNPECTGASATFTATPFNGGSAPAYQWKVNGVNAGTNSATFSTSTLTNGQIVTCIMTSNLPGATGNPATSNAIAMTVNPFVTPAVSIAITFGNNPTCSGSTVTFTAIPVNGGYVPSYQWKVNGTNAGTNNASFSTSTLTNGQIVSCVMTTSVNCPTTPTATSNNITMTVNPVVNPVVTITQTSGTNPQCSGASATFTANVTNGTPLTYQWKLNGTNVGTNNSTYTNAGLTNGQTISCDVTATSSCSVNNVNTLGTGTGTNATNSDVGAPYPTYYGNGRQQYLIKASELTALGFTAGSINSLGFSVAGTTGNPSTLNGYTIKVGTTTATATTTTFLTSTFTTVFGPVNYTPILNSLNTHLFSTPFTWNGTSNIIIDLCFSNQVTGTIPYQTYQTSSSFYSTTYYQADGSGGAGACSQTSGSRASIRPNMTFNIGSNTASASSNTITMIVNSTVPPTVSIALTSGTNPLCAGSSETFTATPTNGGSSPSYQWLVDGSNAGTNSATFTTSSLTNGQVVSCILTSNSACASPPTATSNGITMTVNPSDPVSVSINITSGSNPECIGSSVTFTATPVNGGLSPSFQWKNGATNVGTNSPTFTSTAFNNGNIVSCVMTSNASCVSGNPATSNAITMIVNPHVTAGVSIISSPGDTICSGTNVTFTATPSNGGALPSYQWKIGATNAGTNSITFSSSSLNDGDVVTCVMTSNASCVTGSPATSNAVTMKVNPNVTAGVSIVTSPGDTICSGTNVTFTATPSNGGALPSYQWNIGATNAGTNSTTFSSSTLNDGDVVTCVMTSNASCVTGSPATSNAVTMKVNPNVTAGVSIVTSPGDTICSGTNVTFTATPSNGGASPSYQWKIGATNAGTNSTTFSSSSLNDGEVVTCVMTSNASCVTGSPATSNAVTMKVNPNVTAGVSIVTSPGDTICSGTNVTFTATPSNGGALPSYQWKIGATNAGTNSTTFSSSTLNDGDVVTCVMTSNASCVTGSPATSNTVMMKVNPNVTAGVSIVTSPGDTICSGTNVTFTATPSNGGASPSYQWKIGATNTGTNSTTFSSLTLNNGDIVTCVMTSNASCVTGSPATSNTVMMKVNPNVTAGVSIVTSPGDTICSGTNVMFTATPSNGGALPSYQWKIGATNAGSNSTTFSSSSLNDGDVVTCVMTSNVSCVTGSPATSNAVTMKVNPNVTAGVSIVTSPGDTICSGTNVTFTATPSNGGALPSYQWKIGATNAGTNSTTFSSSSLNTGDIVTCVMTSNASCVTGSPATSNTVTMMVNETPEVDSFIPAGVSPGAMVTIDGLGFTGTSSVEFDGMTAVFTVINDSEITATVPNVSTEGLITVTTPCGAGSSSSEYTLINAVTLKIKVLIEGFYAGTGEMRGILSPAICDTVEVSLANTVPPYLIFNSQRGVIDTAGNGAFDFPGSARGRSYYVVVNHRNSLETWSGAPVSLPDSVNSYDFTTGASQAFGSNEVDQGGKFAILSGDINQDGIINTTDLSGIATSASVFLTGYYPSDLTGDGLVESSDFSLVENNLSLIVLRP